MDSIKNIFLLECKRYKNQIIHKRIKFFIKSNKYNITLLNETNIIAKILLENFYKNQKSKTLRIIIK